MLGKRKSIFFILLFIGLLYFFVFWFPNSTGAHDLNMTYVFNSDEPAQYPAVIRMLTPAPSLPQSLYRFFAYQIYFYGFPYYFYSAVIVLLPLKLIWGLGNLQLNMLVLRQFVSVLPMIAALMILVYLQTKFESYLKSLALFLLLLLIPEVVFNDMWFHPESLVFLFIVLTFFFLTRDDLKFGKDFYLAALFCGLSVATKQIGLFFCLAIPLYIFLGWRRKSLDVRRSVVVAVIFVGIMAAVFVLTNPFLLWASERKLALQTQITLHRHIASGFVVLYHNSVLDWLRVVNEEYSTLPFLLLAVVAAIIGCVKGERRLLNLLILAWVVPFTIYICVALAIRPKHFPMPILLPLYSTLPAYFMGLVPPHLGASLGHYLRKYGARLFLLFAGIVVAGWQFAYSLNTDISQYLETLQREKDSASLNFYVALDKSDLSRIELNRPLVVFRDVVMYVPNAANDKVNFQWGVSGYAYIHKINADLLLLSKQHLRDYTQNGPSQTAVDPNFSDAYHFYTDALAEQVQGYTLIYQDDFGMAYISTPLYNQFFSTH
ncbi:MAG TPA: hypothetical protein VLX61_07335 [Anaerolineales bacterium]|nr:hypothetical protein [Anaerolineales bacterium]